mmetsp:Transcript_6662/g.20968  ORF Transcript_6662/g.20968 Transcript_6662/m.20968 type:complete len:216 (-) Transcript_6662:39-686(-)
MHLRLRALFAALISAAALEIPVRSRTSLRTRPRRPSPLPTHDEVVTAPKLSATERLRLRKDGECTRKVRSGRGGACLHVVETAEDEDVVWRQLSDVGAWAEMMRGVKSSRVAPRRDGDVYERARFSITKFRLPCALVLAEAPAPSGGRALRFALDPDARSPAVQECSGAWVVERCGDVTRVSLAANIRATPLVPGLLVEAIAAKALNRATAWLRR